MIAAVEKVLEKYKSPGRDSLIPILQDVQDEEGYISKEAVKDIGAKLGLPASKVYGVATFYNQFRFKPLGRYHIQVCRGTACHVKGSAVVLDRIERELGIKAGDTTGDGMFSIEVVACIGACGLAPVISVAGNYHANLTEEDVPEILESYRADAAKEV